MSRDNLQSKLDAMMSKRKEQDSKARINMANRILESNRYGEKRKAMAHYELYKLQAKDKWLHLGASAREGHAGACYEMARNYMQGNVVQGIEKDMELAKEFIELGLDNQAHAAEFNTADYENDQYVEMLRDLKDVAEAVQQFGM